MSAGRNGFEIYMIGSIMSNSSNRLLNSSANLVSCAQNFSGWNHFSLSSIFSSIFSRLRKCCSILSFNWKDYRLSFNLNAFTALIVCGKFLPFPCSSQFSSFNVDVISVSPAAIHYLRAHCTLHSLALDPKIFAGLSPRLTTSHLHGGAAHRK